ncbi:MutY A/G-specific DNA glycosylase [Rhabdaerophilaceae bacterium]
MVAVPACDVKPFDFAAALLAWYDRHGRDLPWRVKHGEADPYKVWLSEIMLQQTTVEAVKPYYAKFLALWPDIRSLAEAEDQAVLAAWAGLGYYARARNLLACARALMHECGGHFPKTEAELRLLPGIGAYTAAAVAAIAFGERALVIDGNVERVMTRLGAIATPLPQARRAIRDSLEGIAPVARAGDFAQAMMDLGATVCTPKKPACMFCPWQSACSANAFGTTLDFPVKAVKKARSTQFTTAFVVLDRDDRVLLRSRPASGLLAKMAEVPNTPWMSKATLSTGQDPVSAAWITLSSPVTHVFTHIALTVTVKAGRIESCPAPADMRWVTRQDLDREPLPTLMRKIIAAGLSGLGISA